MNGGRKKQCSMEGWEEPHCIHMIFPVAEITGAHGIFFFSHREKYRNIFHINEGKQAALTPFSKLGK